MTELEDKLTRALYRKDCPDPIELGEYQLNMVPRDRARYIQDHLAECPLCAREMAQLQEYLAGLAADLELTPMERVRDRVKVIIARLLPDPAARLQGSLGTPAFAGLRGSEADLLVYQAGEVELAVEIDEDAARPDRKQVAGLVTGLAEPGTAAAHLWQAGRSLRTVPIDDLGNFEISDLAPGVYELIIGNSETEVHIQDLPVRPG